MTHLQNVIIYLCKIEKKYKVLIPDIELHVLYHYNIQSPMYPSPWRLINRSRSHYLYGLSAIFPSPNCYCCGRPEWRHSSTTSSPDSPSTPHGYLVDGRWHPQHLSVGVNKHIALVPDFVVAVGAGGHIRHGGENY